MRHAVRTCGLTATVPKSDCWGINKQASNLRSFNDQQRNVLSGRRVVEIKDKVGRVFEIVLWDKEGPESLMTFYDKFEPKGKYQGIPPVHKQARNTWINELMANWQNFLIIDGNRVVGHAAISEDNGSVQEVIIFLHQDYRGRGIGKGALNSIRNWLEGRGSGRLWLSVQSTNLTAIHCFLKVGFQFTTPPLEPEREMVLDLEE